MSFFGQNCLHRTFYSCCFGSIAAMRGARKWKILEMRKSFSSMKNVFLLTQTSPDHHLPQIHNLFVFSVHLSQNSVDIRKCSRIVSSQTLGKATKCLVYIFLCVPNLHKGYLYVTKPRKINKRLKIWHEKPDHIFSSADSMLNKENGGPSLLWDRPISNQ